jgi:hypothetical protein
VSDLFEVLDDRERKIIVQRFGLDGGKPKTLEEMGKKSLRRSLGNLPHSDSIDARKYRRCRNSIAWLVFFESLEEIGVLFLTS